MRKTKLKKKPIFIILGIFLFIFLFIYFCIPRISLKEGKEYLLEYQTEYVDPGYVGKFLGMDVTNDVKVEHSIDNNKLGDYEVTYKLKKFLFTNTQVRTVKVVDRTKPEITLKGETKLKMCPKKTYEEEGFESKDNYDGDLTEKVEKEELEDKVLYKVKDSSGNEQVVERTIERIDEENPTITLRGGEVYNVLLGTSYSEPGYTVSDNCDEDLQDKVQVTGTVDTNTVGTYEVKYTVKDTFGNTSEKVRTVIVSKEVKTNNPVKGAIYLTFDDGPSATITPKLLDILKKKNVKATFFVINHEPELDYLFTREYNEGHVVANHSYYHDYAKVYKSTDAYFEDLELISNKIEKLTGHRSNIIRFPGGSSNTVSKHYSVGIMSKLTLQVINKGYHYFDWNVDSDDAGSAKTSEQVYNNVVKGLSKNKANIVLMHDFESNYKTLNALSDIIDYGLANGYQFLTLDMSTAMVRHGVNN